MIEIRSRSGLVLKTLDATNFIQANLAGPNLTGPNLTGANLTRVNLIGTELTGANLAGANLTRAALIGARLLGADLAGANLAGADLTGADLTGANLAGANLTETHLDRAGLSWAVLAGARLNWRSRDLIAELLYRAAGPSLRKREIAGAILISKSLTDNWCWENFEQHNVKRPRQLAWVASVLAPRVQDGDDAPQFLRVAKAALDAISEPKSEAQSEFTPSLDERN